MILYRRLFKLLCFMTGMFVTMPILTITSISGHRLSIFSVLFLIFIFSLVVVAYFHKLRFPVNVPVQLLLSWFAFITLSSLTGLLYFQGMPTWSSAVAGYLIKIPMFFLAFIFLLITIKKEYIINLFLSGFIFGCIINLIWSLFEGIFFILTSNPLNNIVFSEYMMSNVNIQTLTIIKDGTIRASGLNYDPAHLGCIIPIIAVYAILKRNILLFILVLLSLIFSQSTTAAMASFLGVLVTINLRNILKLRVSKAVIKGLLIGVVFITVLISSAIYSGGGLTEGIIDNIEHFTDRVTQKVDDSSASKSNMRVLYHQYLPEAVTFLGPVALVGLGFGVASHPYVNNYEVNVVLEKPRVPYDPESTYISYLVDTGFIGLGLYLLLLYVSYFFHKKNLYRPTSKIIYAGLCGVIFSSLFYHYIFTAYHVLLIIMAVVLSARSMNGVAFPRGNK